MIVSCVDGTKKTERSTTMFEDGSSKTSGKKSENELLRELADLVARRELDSRLGVRQVVNQDDIRDILNNLGYSVA